MNGQEKLVGIPRDVALIWQDDAVKTLEDLLVHLVTKGWNHIPDATKAEREDALLSQATDLLFRAGRL